MEATYEDTYFDSDVLVMEMNSRGMSERLAAINSNAEAVADMLYARSVAAGVEGAIIKEVFYPKYQARENYDRCRNIAATEAGLMETGYSCLLSMSFVSLGTAKEFYSALQCYKGPTLGTVFTVATPFTALTFPSEKMQWAKDHYLEESLVRFSIGTEGTSSLLNGISKALEAAEQWQRAQGSESA